MLLSNEVVPVQSLLTNGGIMPTPLENILNEKLGEPVSSEGSVK